MDSDKTIISTGSSSPETHTSNEGMSNDNTGLTTITAPDSTTDTIDDDEEKETGTIEEPCTHEHTTPWLTSELVTMTQDGKPRLRGSAKGHLLRHKLARQDYVREQIAQGRADSSQTWCGDPSCNKEGRVFRAPALYLTDEEECQNGHSVKGYFDDLAGAMVARLFPNLQKPEEKANKSFEIMSFMNSPPVRSAFWRMTSTSRVRHISPTDAEFEEALLHARPVFLDLMFSTKTAERVGKVHSYLDASPQVMDKWKLVDFVVGFLIAAELWRRQHTPRRRTWVMGSRERVGEFLVAVLASYRLLLLRGCIDTDTVFMDECWDRIWQEWLEKYPAPDVLRGDDEDDFQLRERLEQTQEDVLERVGYLGGVGKGEGKYALSRTMPEEHLAFMGRL